MNAAITFERPDGRFTSDGAPQFPARRPYWGGHATEAEMRSEIARLWQAAVQARAPEIDRMQMLERVYAGFHYKRPEDNRRLPRTNMCYSNVETIHATMTERKPRLEIVPRRAALSSDVAMKIKEFAGWWQDASGAMRVRRRGTRTKIKYGMCIYVITVDYETGMPYLVDWSPFDYYPDASASTFHGCQHHFLAGPVSTEYLRHIFPDAKDEAGNWKILPDNYASPSYDVMVQPYLDSYPGMSTSLGRMQGQRVTNLESTAPYQGATQPSGTTSFVPANSAGQHQGSDTTFFVQFIARDYGKWRALYSGKLTQASAAGEVQIDAYHEQDEPCSPSGWTVVSLTGWGDVLDISPVDEAFMGLPFAVSFFSEQEGRLAGKGAIDEIWPINRAYNERKNLLNQSLQLASIPAVKVTKGSGINFDKGGVQAGDVLEVPAGKDIMWLEYDGPSEHQFEMLLVERKDLQDVGGISDSAQGVRPEGIEAGVAIRQLQDASQTRIRGAIVVDQDDWAQVVLKCLRVAAKKLRSDIAFKASNGDILTITNSELDALFDIRAAEGSGHAQGEKELEEKALNMFQLGLLTPTRALRDMNYPEWQAAGMEIEQMQIAQAQAEAEAAAASGGPNGNGGGSKNGGKEKSGSGGKRF